MAQFVPDFYRGGYLGPAAEDRILTTLEHGRFFLAHAAVPINRDSFEAAVTKYGGVEMQVFAFTAPSNFVP